MRCVAVLVLAVASANAANQPAFVYTLPGFYAEFGVTAAAVDPVGNTYLTGYTYVPIPVSADAYQPQPAPSLGYCPYEVVSSGIPFGPCSAAFLIKLDPTGAVVYGTYLGGGWNDSGTSIAIDAAGNIYVAGMMLPPNTSLGNMTPPNNFPATPGAAFATSSVPSAFVTKFDPTGHTLIYSTYIPGITVSATIALDPAGNVYVGGTTRPACLPASGCGNTYTAIFPTTSGALQPSAKNNSTAGVIAALNASGSALIYATYLSGSAPASINGIDVDGDGDAFVTGFTADADFPVTAGTFQTKLPNTTSVAFVTKIIPQGNAVLYSTFLGGNGADFGHVIKVDLQGEAWVLGQTSSTDFPVTSGAFESTPNVLFLTHLRADGVSPDYSTYFPGTGSAIHGLDLNAAGEPYVASSVSVSSLPTGPAAFQSNFSGDVLDVYIAKFGSNGRLEGASYLGGSSGTGVNMVAAAPNGSVVVVGTTQSPDFPGIIQPLPNGNVTYVTRLSPWSTPPIERRRTNRRAE